MRSVLRPGLLRRLTLALVGTVLVTTLVLGLGSYFLVQAALERDARDEATSQSRFNLLLARTILPPDRVAADFDRLLEALAIRGTFQTLILSQDQAYVSGLEVSRGLVSDELAARVAAGRLSYQYIERVGVPTIVVGGMVDEVTTAYFFYPLDDQARVLDQLRLVLVAAGAALALLGSLLAAWLARRIGRPILSASAAAGRMAAGELDVRLPPASGELGELSASFNTMAANLSAKIDALTAAEARERRFVGDVSHELRTPLAALVGEASLLAAQVAELPEGSLPPDTRTAVDLLVKDVGRLRRLVDDLLEISRIDAKAAQLHWEEVDLFDFLARLVAGRSWPVTVVARPPFGGAAGGEPGFQLVLRTDRRRLERILLNLVENAVLHGRPPVTIDVSLGTGAEGLEQLLIAVVDRGPGIAPELRHRVYERFFKADPSRSSPGSGLGLAIAWENARLLGGSLTVEGEPGESRFLVSLPLHEVTA